MGKKISICDALSILESNPTKIITVSDWADGLVLEFMLVHFVE